MYIKTKRTNYRRFFELLKACIVPRPVVLISTIDDKGIYNAAPFSSCTTVATLPPMLCFAAGPYKNNKKDTIRNIEIIGDFVVNIVDDALEEKMMITAKPFPPNVDEFKEAEITPLPGTETKSPRIAESPIQMECVLEKILELGEIPDYLVIGKVLCYHIRDDLIGNNDIIDYSQLKPLGNIEKSWV